MFKKTMVLVIVVLFAVGTSLAMAEGTSACKDKNVLQCMYNWFAGCEKPSAQTTKNTCRACNAACCKTCQTDCGGKCCAKCGQK